MILTEIGSNETTALICHTNITDCCRTTGSSVLSDWIYPQGERVQSYSRQDGDPFTRNRGSGTVFLYRNEMSMGPSGIYSCEIEDPQSNTSQELQVGVYPLSEGN